MISLNGISKTFNKGLSNQVNAISKLDLKINEGEYLVIVGANGSGKSTLLNLVAGSILPSEGSIIFGDQDVTRLPDHRRCKWLARVFQDPLRGTAPDLTIIDNFRLAALRTGRKSLKIGVNDTFKKL